jgi:hypothetical protein
MRSFSLLAGLSALVLASNVAQAGDIVSSNNQLSLDFAAVNFGYKETGNGIFGTPTGTLDTETRWVPGVSVSLSAMQDWGLQNLYLSARYTYFNGNTSYVGGHLFPPTPFGSVRASDGATVNDIDARLGKGLALGPNVMMTPFFGMGYQDWNRAVNAGEDYTHAYYGGGLLLQVSPFNRLVLSADALVGETFDSHINVQGLNGFSGSLGNSMIYKLGLSGDYAITPTIHANAGVEYENFSYGMSAIHVIPMCCAVWEPDSRTSNVTVRVGLGIAFGSDRDYQLLK